MLGPDLVSVWERQQDDAARPERVAAGACSKRSSSKSIDAAVHLSSRWTTDFAVQLLYAVKAQLLS